MIHAAFLLLVFAASAIAQPDPTAPERYAPLAVGNEWHYERFGSLEGAGYLGFVYARSRVVGATAIDGFDYLILLREQASEAVPVWGESGRDTVRFDGHRAVVVSLRDGAEVDLTCPLNADFGAVVSCAVGGEETTATAVGLGVGRKGFAPPDPDAPVPVYRADIGFVGFDNEPDDRGVPGEDLFDLTYARIVHSDGASKESGVPASFPVRDADPTDPTRYIPLFVGFEKERDVLYGGAGHFRYRTAVVRDSAVAGRTYAIQTSRRGQVVFDPSERTLWEPETRRLLRYDSTSTRLVEWTGDRERWASVPLGADVGTLVAQSEAPPRELPDGRVGDFAVLRVEPTALAVGGVTLPVEAVKAFVPVPVRSLADILVDLTDRYGTEVGVMPQRFYSGCPCWDTVTFLRTRDADGALIELGTRFPVADEAKPTATALAVAIAPNPTAGPLALALDLPEAGAVTVEAFDALGRRVWRHEAALSAGRQRLGVDAGRWAPGLYVVRARAGEATATATVVRR
ncbi:hypothetical protein [Rubrivirga sp. IMCC43871]|uniref:hypothetical protein n=1 Tax=Rubrivirga sp. IMCC43871 TaxID=3391575 RepID=UPI00398FB489